MCLMISKEDKLHGILCDYHVYLFTDVCLFVLIPSVSSLIHMLIKYPSVTFHVSCFIISFENHDILYEIMCAFQ